MLLPTSLRMRVGVLLSISLVVVVTLVSLNRNEDSPGFTDLFIPRVWSSYGKTRYIDKSVDNSDLQPGYWLDVASASPPHHQNSALHRLRVLIRDLHHRISDLKNRIDNLSRARKESAEIQHLTAKLAKLRKLMNALEKSLHSLEKPSKKVSKIKKISSSPADDGHVALIRKLSGKVDDAIGDVQRLQKRLERLEKKAKTPSPPTVVAPAPSPPLPSTSSPSPPVVAAAPTTPSPEEDARELAKKRFYQSGQTPFGKGWQSYGFGTGALVIDVDVSDFYFKEVPVYITSVGGTTGHWRLSGAGCIYLATTKGFRVFVRDMTGRTITPALAEANKWHVNWMAFGSPEVMNGLKHVHFGREYFWRQYDKQTIYSDVSTRDGNFMSTPVYFTTAGGQRNLMMTSGATAVYQASLDHLRMYLRITTKGKGLTVTNANKYDWHVNWVGFGNIKLPGLRFGTVDDWQQYDGTEHDEGIYVDINVTPPFSVVPKYFACIKGSQNMWAAVGPTAIYNATIHGFRVWVRPVKGCPFKHITVDDALRWDWSIDWLAATGTDNIV